MKLWDYYDGEPFMENPHLAIIGANPYKVGSIIERKKAGFRKISQKGKGKKNMARRKATRRKARKNFPTAGLAFNPRRKTRTYSMKKSRGVYRAKSNPRRKSHRGRRNPAVLGVTLPPMNMIAWGAGGFIAPPMVENFVSQFLPTEFATSVMGRYALKIGSVLGLTYLTKTVLSAKEAFPVALGGSLYVVVSAINEFMPQLTAVPAPATGVSAYRTGMIKAYRQGMIGTGVQSYARSNLARANTSLAAGPRWGLGPSGMTNPTDADPRFNNAKY